MINLGKYSTISVPEEVKATLEKDKGDRDWGEFLLELYNTAKDGRRRLAFAKLVDMLDEDDLNRIERSSEEFRREFKLR